MLKNINEVRAMLELAAEVDRSMPKVKALDAKALWPEIRLTESEKKALRRMTREGEPDFTPNDDQKKVWETVTTEWIKAFQDSERRRQQWTVIWLKAYGCRVKTIERHVSFGRTKIWYEYERGMAHLLNFLQVNYTKEDLRNTETYKPEIIQDYPVGKISGITKINILKEWLEELKIENDKL